MKQLENKWLLLDANVVIEQILHSKHSFWADFASKIGELNCKTIITPEVRFELFRRIQSKNDEQSLLNRLQESGIEILALPNPDGWQRATKIAQIYALNKLDGKSLIDCLLASYLEHYGDNLYLATFNNKDFPITLFDRESMLNFEVKNEIKVLSIYKFSQEKFLHLKSKFGQSLASKYK